MIIHPDFKELLQSFESHKVEYMIVGGYAVAYHGYARLTKDIDIFYRLSDENIGRIRESMVDFGFTESEVRQTEFKYGEIVRFGVPPLRVDLLNQIDGLIFDEAAPNQILDTYGDAPARFIGREDLLRNKRASARLRDKADVEELE